MIVSAVVVAEAFRHPLSLSLSITIVSVVDGSRDPRPEVTSDQTADAINH